MSKKYPEIHLRPGKAESLKRFHPWVFSGAIARTDADICEGDIVKVVDAEGHTMGVGHYQQGTITVRMLSFKDTTIDNDFWIERISEALQLRRSLDLIRPDNNIFRLVHGEGDRLPGLIIDVFGNTAVVQAHSYGMHLARLAVAEALSQVCPELTAIYYKSETTMTFRGVPQPAENGWLLGQSEQDTAVENGLSYHIDWLKGQKTGFFVDQRENRSLLRSMSHGRNVLNMFCYTGGFSINALSGGASSVCSVDSSSKAIDLCNANAQLNFGSPDADGRHEALAEDAFHYLREMPANHFDLIVLDPPAFAKHKDALRNALKGYTRLNAQALEKLPHGGVLFTFSCSQAVNKDQFRLAVFTAAAQTGRHVRLLHQLHQPADHPISIYHPEGEYLKGLVLQVE